MINVNAGQSIQSAINSAPAGEIISVEAGAVFNELLLFPDKNSTSVTTIQSSRISELDPDKQVTAADASKMPKIIAPALSSTQADRAIKFAPAAHNWKLLGLEVTHPPTIDARTILEIGDPNQTSLDQIPYGITLDRCFVHGQPDRDSQRGIGLNAKLVDILNCRISEIHGIGYDTQAICGWNGIGQYKIINCFLEGAGENLMFGGADPAIPNLVASDIEIRRCTFYKPFTWKVGHPSYAGKHWTVKNLLELKAAKRVVIDGCIFDGNWVEAQTGWAILFKVQNQDGTCPQCVTEEIDFTNNTIKNSTNGLNILAYDPYKGSGQLKNVRVLNNLWLVDDAWYQGTGEGKLPDGSTAPFGCDGLTLEHNTHLQQTGNTMTLYGKPTLRFVYRNNLGARTGYGIKGDGTGEGNVAFQTFAPNAVIQANVLAKADPNTYPSGNFYPATWEEVQLGADYRLAGASPYKGKGTDGKDPGVDMDALLAAQSAAGTPPTPTPPTPTPTPPIVYPPRRIAQPNSEAKWNVLLAQQKADGYFLTKFLVGQWVQFEKM